jgi:hypothetical protein
MVDMPVLGYPPYLNRIPVTVGLSPFVVTNSLSVLAEVFISIGTVLLVEFSRDQVTWDGCGLLAGQFRLNPGDSLRITYVIAPVVIVYPF